MDSILYLWETNPPVPVSNILSIATSLLMLVLPVLAGPTPQLWVREQLHGEVGGRDHFNFWELCFWTNSADADTTQKVVFISMDGWIDSCCDLVQNELKKVEFL